MPIAMFQIHSLSGWWQLLLIQSSEWPQITIYGLLDSAVCVESSNVD